MWNQNVRLSKHHHLLVVTILWVLLANFPTAQYSQRKCWESACCNQRNFALLSTRGVEDQEIRQHAELYRANSCATVCQPMQVEICYLITMIISKCFPVVCLAHMEPPLICKTSLLFKCKLVFICQLIAFPGDPRQLTLLPT